MNVYDIALEYAKSKLDEAYKKEESIKESASIQIAIFSFLITGIISLEIGLYENNFRFFTLSLIFSSIVIFTMLLAVLFAILSQWRMKRDHFPKVSEVIAVLNSTDNEEKQERIGKEQLIGSYKSAADTMDANNDIRTKLIFITHIMAIISIAEMFFFSFTIFIILLTV